MNFKNTCGLLLCTKKSNIKKPIYNLEGLIVSNLKKCMIK